MTLVMLICLAAAPETCRDERVLISLAEISAIACLAGAPVTIAEWGDAHPDWRVQRWRCEPADIRGARR